MPIISILRTGAIMFALYMVVYQLAGPHVPHRIAVGSGAVACAALLAWSAANPRSWVWRERIFDGVCDAVWIGKWLLLVLTAIELPVSRFVLATWIHKMWQVMILAAIVWVDWLTAAATDGFLATLEADGSASFEPWLGLEKGALERVSTLIEGTKPGERGWLALAAMDRYMHVTVDAAGRLAVPANLLAHLDPDVTGYVRIVVFDGYLKAWSEKAWLAGRAERAAALGF